MPDYSKGKIYKIVNIVDNEIYVGSTVEKLCKRMTNHRCSARNTPKCKIHKHMANIGVENFIIVLIESHPCKTKEELIKKEREYTLQLGTLNSKIEGRTNEDYRRDNKDYHTKICKEYREKHREQINECVVCQFCGNSISKSNLKRHYKSKLCLFEG